MSRASSPENQKTSQVYLQNGTLVIRGDWTLSDYQTLKQLVEECPDQRWKSEHIDLKELGRVDTAGASLLATLLGPEVLSKLAKQDTTLPREQGALLQAVADALHQRPASEPKNFGPVRQFLTQTGQTMEGIWHLLYQLAGFAGQILATLFTILPRFNRWRVTPFVAAIQDTGLNALPIVALLTFLVGAVVAFLGATVLSDFGATIYTVNLVAFRFCVSLGFCSQPFYLQVALPVHSRRRLAP